jgi:hypothetical protein
MVAVNWQHLSRAISHYTTAGYAYVEVPWVVPTDIILATCPEERWVVHSDIGNLIGSSEQSFIHLDQIGELGIGQFVACTPCFRNEDVVDQLRQKTFMKVELYDNENTNDDGLISLVNKAIAFYRTLIDSSLWGLLEVVALRDGTFDIDLGGIEIGSYGMRTYKGKPWLYGTAIAEPRFSTALNRICQARE